MRGVHDTGVVIGEQFPAVVDVTEDRDRSQHDVACVLLQLLLAVDGRLEDVDRRFRRLLLRPAHEVGNDEHALVVVTGDRHASFGRGWVKTRRRRKRGHLLKDAARLLGELFALVGCHDRIALADEQRIVEGLSQPLDGVAYGGLVDAEKLGGIGKRGAVLDSNKRLQGREVHTGKLVGQHGHSPPCKFSMTSI
ncbi:hypothetical protein AJ88_31775 [Mesorhizobium amorphae CCBAU 01583]|nr:hypothetical protein AJ88_31775 [Mesorhizobium amorphae CCBAU 01583]